MKKRKKNDKCSELLKSFVGVNLFDYSLLIQIQIY